MEGIALWEGTWVGGIKGSLPPQILFSFSSPLPIPLTTISP